MTQKNYEIRVLLHDIRSSHNVGSILRTADAIGVSQVYFSGYTPLPVDRFKRPNKEIAKTALGAEKSILWEHSSNFNEIVYAVKKEGFLVIGLEQDSRSIDYRTFTPPNNALVIVGSEVDGIINELRELCDVIVEIPMRGSKESLNVSVAFGVAMFRLFDR